MRTSSRRWRWGWVVVGSWVLGDGGPRRADAQPPAVEATPDTVITLTNGSKIVVAEPPERVVADVRDHKIEILAGAMSRRDQLRGERAVVRKAAPLRVTTPVTPLPVTPIPVGVGGTDKPGR